MLKLNLVMVIGISRFTFEKNLKFSLDIKT